jgi:hypothetical protein
VSSALEGRDELQHGFTTANGKELMYLMHLEERTRVKKGRKRRQK